MVSTLSHDLIKTYFSNLDTKSLARFKLTCKTLYDKIQIQIPKDMTYIVCVTYLENPHYAVVAICNSTKTAEECKRQVSYSICLLQDAHLEEDETSEANSKYIYCYVTPTSCKITYDQNIILHEVGWTRVPLNQVFDHMKLIDVM